MHSWDLLSPWFSASEKFSLIVGGVPSPATIFPLLWEDHVNNHIFLGVPPQNMDTQTPCQVEATPCNPEGIEPFSMVNSPPCKVEAMSSHLINNLSGKFRVTPRNPEGIEPFTTVDPPPCQVGVTPHKSEGIEPFTLVNSLPGHIGVMPLHLINTPSGPCEVASLISSQVPTSTLPCVNPVLPLSVSVPVIDPSSYGFPPVMSPLCPLSPDASSAPLKTMQAMSHKQPVDIPIGSDCP